MSLLDCHCKTLFQQGASWGLGCTARISSSIRSFPAKVDIQQLKCISVEWWISSLFICYLLLFCQFSWARLCTAMQVLFQPRRESMLLLQWVRYFFIMNIKKRWTWWPGDHSVWTTCSPGLGALCAYTVATSTHRNILHDVSSRALTSPVDWPRTSGKMFGMVTS